MRRLVPCAVLLAVAVALPAGGARAGAKLEIDHVDGSAFVKKGRITFFANLLDDDHTVISGLEPEDVSVYIDDEKVPGEFTVQTAREANEPAAVAILMAGHRSYAPIGPSEKGNSAFAFEKQGFANFVRKLGGGDRVGVYMYHEKGLRTIESWSEDHSGTADSILQRANLPSHDEDVSALAPNLYRAINEVVVDKVGAAENLPRRRVLLLMSDGKGRAVSNSRKVERRIERIVEAARTHGTEVYALGFTMDIPDHLVHLSTLAKKTGGVYRRIKGDQMGEIPAIISGVADELKKQYVITFEPHEDYDGSPKPVEMRLKVETPKAKQNVEDGYDQPVRIGEKPFDWWALLYWIGVVLGSLLGLFLLWKLISAIIASRRDTDDDDDEEEEYEGPYKARLTATEGPHVGNNFYVTDEVTTIGSIPGNSIVLEDPGVSKRHAGVKVDDMRFELADFGSTNGTFVNGQKITKQFLRDGDEVRLGETTLRFSLK